MNVGEPAGAALITSDSAETKVHKCEWHNCQTTHFEKVEYPNDGVLDGSNLKSLENTDYYPWLLGQYGMSPTDQAIFGSTPQASFPEREDYLLESTKGAISERLTKNKLKRSDLPPEITAILDDKSVPKKATISLAPLASSPNVAEIAFELNSRNCLPYEDQFAEWSESRIYESPRYPCEAHHLLSKQFFGAGTEGQAFTDLAADAKLIGYDVNCFRNGIMLPRFAVDIVCHGLPQHEGNHDQTDYNKKIADILKPIQTKCRKYCEPDILGDQRFQVRLLDQLESAAQKVRRRIVNWEQGYQLRTDNFERREAAYKRINLMLLFDASLEGYPDVTEDLYKRGKCPCTMCAKES